jgi:hypothetical protein
MTWRTTLAAVQQVLGGTAPGSNWDGVTDLTPYIDTANALVNRVVVCACQKCMALTSVEQELVERWMSAHYYTKMDPVYTSKSTAGASGSFVRGPQEPEPYKDAAINIDVSGCLNAYLKRLTATGRHVGGRRGNRRFGYGTNNQDLPNGGW